MTRAGVPELEGVCDNEDCGRQEVYRVCANVPEINASNCFEANLPDNTDPEIRHLGGQWSKNGGISQGHPVAGDGLLRQRKLAGLASLGTRAFCLTERESGHQRTGNRRTLCSTAGA